MPPEVSSHNRFLDSSLDTEPYSSRQQDAEILPEPFQVDSYADRLMDDLFDDVERLLEGAVPPATSVQVEAPPKPKLEIAPPPLSSGLLNAPNFPQWKPKPEDESLSLLELSELAKTNLPEPRRSVLDRLLILATCTSAVVALLVWLVNQGHASRLLSAFTDPAPTVAPTTVAQAPQPVDTNLQFSEYMQRSLEAIDRKAATGKSEGLPTAPYNSGLPSVPLSKNQPPLSSTTSLPKVPVIVNVPSAPGAPVADTSRNRELNQILNRLAGVLERLYPAANRQVAVQPAPPVVQPGSSQAVSPQRTMVGILEGSDPSRSAVLFEMNGVTQRYYIGESIGSSGWSLVEVSKQYATIRRNGQVKTLAVGQKL